MLKDILRLWQRRVVCQPWRIAADIGLYRGSGPPIHFVIENANWAIRWVGEHVGREIEAISPGTITTSIKPYRLAHRVVHFGSQYMWLAWGRHMSQSNRYVVSFFHGKREDGADVSRHVDEFLDSAPRIGRIVTSAGLVEQRLLAWGVPRKQIVRIPIGVDTRLFSPPTETQRRAARAIFGIADDAVAIGSFQKDGVGWGDGMEPKLIKGPDIFLDAVERLARHIPVVVVLTGPARGFVKRGLARMGIPFVHRYVQSHAELVSCYHALDLYMVTSREEGGPMGLMESMASGVPVVSTPVGMAPDLIADGICGGLTRSADANEVSEKAMQLLSLPENSSVHLKARAMEAVKVCDWSVVGRRHLEEVYLPLFEHASA